MNICDKCGDTFNCDIKNCWCFEYPNVLPILSNSCICENCLKKVMEEQKMLVDYKKRQMKIGQRVRVEVDIPSSEGMLYKHTLVKVDDWNQDSNKIRVTDSTGKVWWVEPTQVSCGFL